MTKLVAMKGGRMSRLRPGMSVAAKAAIFGDGNMGAASVALQLADLSEDYFLFLDDLDITGGNLYLLFNDVCSRSAVQLGLLLVVARAGELDLDREKLIFAAQNRGAGIDMSAVLALAKEISQKYDHLL